jgi:hypothetical protein
LSMRSGSTACAMPFQFNCENNEMPRRSTQL